MTHKSEIVIHIVGGNRDDAELLTGELFDTYLESPGDPKIFEVTIDNELLSFKSLDMARTKWLEKKAK